jgi:ribosomal protein S18 acetylase RimI-like enzyme
VIQARKSHRDDRSIFELIKKELLPFTRQSNPTLKFNRKDVKYRLSKVKTFVIKPAGRRCFGFISYFVHDKQLFIDMLAIDKSYSGKGWGSKLLTKAERIGKRRGCMAVLLYVDEVNTNAQRFYERKGFRPAGYEPKLKCYLFEKVLVQ